MKLHITYFIKQFSSFGSINSDIPIKCLKCSLSFSIKMKTMPVLITTLTIQCAVYRLYCGVYC